jgi:hypothetical protein
LCVEDLPDQLISGCSQLQQGNHTSAAKKKKVPRQEKLCSFLPSNAFHQDDGGHSLNGLLFLVPSVLDLLLKFVTILWQIMQATRHRPLTSDYGILLFSLFDKKKERDQTSDGNQCCWLQQHSHHQGTTYQKVTHYRKRGGNQSVSGTIAREHSSRASPIHASPSHASSSHTSTTNVQSAST